MLVLHRRCPRRWAQRELSSRLHSAGVVAVRSTACLCYPGCAGSCKQCWRNMSLSYLHHYQTQVKSNWLKTIWWILCNTFQQLSSVSHVEISTSRDQMSSSDLITANQLKKLQLNSQQSWNSRWTQGPQHALEKLQYFQKRSCRQLRLPLPYAAAFTYESWICPERLESIPKFFYILFLSSGTTSGNWDPSRQTHNTALICQSNTTLSIFKILVKAAVF